MADVAAAPATPKGKKKAPKAKKAAAASHPPYKNMVIQAIKQLKERNGSSRQAILKYIVANYKVGDEKKAGNRLRIALKKMASGGDLKQVKGAGASGSFRLGEGKASSPKKKAAKKPKSPKKSVAKSTKKATKPKKPAVKKASKPAAAKKPAAKKAAPKKKPAAKKSPKKAAKKSAKK